MEGERERGGRGEREVEGTREVEGAREVEGERGGRREKEIIKLERENKHKMKFCLSYLVYTG